MWDVVLFDLPVTTKENRKSYRIFRDALLDDGFIMLQYSVYGRPCPSEENAQVHSDRVQATLPPDGQVRILTLTDMQFAKMKIFYGKERHKPEKPPEQLSFF